MSMVLGTNFSPLSFMQRGVDADEISVVFEMPELSSNEMLDCLLAACPQQFTHVSSGVATGDADSLDFTNYLHSRNLGWKGLIEEFADRLLSYGGEIAVEVTARNRRIYAKSVPPHDSACRRQ